MSKRDYAKNALIIIPKMIFPTFSARSILSPIIAPMKYYFGCPANPPKKNSSFPFKKILHPLPHPQAQSVHNIFVSIRQSKNGEEGKFILFRRPKKIQLTFSLAILNILVPRCAVHPFIPFFVLARGCAVHRKKFSFSSVTFVHPSTHIAAHHLFVHILPPITSELLQSPPFVPCALKFSGTFFPQEPEAEFISKNIFLIFPFTKFKGKWQQLTIFNFFYKIYIGPNLANCSQKLPPSPPKKL